MEPLLNARGPILSRLKFSYYGIWYLGHPLTSTENFTEIVKGNLSVEGFKRKRGSQI